MSAAKPAFPRPGTLSGRPASQHAEELAAFIALLKQRGARSYLEIGARHGDTFYEVMCALGPEALGVAIDLPGGEWGAASSRGALMAAVARLRKQNRNAYFAFGDSHDRRIVAIAAARAPYDAILIDADHRYEAVRQDYLDYGPLGALVAFHDIAGDGQIQPSSGLEVEVPRLWRELKTTARKHLEFIAPDSAMGIGVILR
jgi:predicted O-methyltransferase YrrM